MKGSDPQYDDSELQHRQIQDDLDRVLSEWEQLLEEAHTDLVNECGTLFDERRALISGTSPSGSTGEPVPGFWLGAMLKSQAMRSVVQQSDKQALEYLEDVRVAPIDTEAGPEGRGVRVEMVFRSNPFFHDEVLFREVRGGMDADILLEMLSFAGGHGSAGGAKDAGKEKSTVSGIRWKHGQDLTVLSKRNSGSRRRKSGSTNGASVMWSDDDPHSLFTLFCPPATLGSTALTQLDRDLSVISSLASEVVLGACRLFMQSEYCPAKPGRMKGTLGSLVRNQELIDRTLKDFFARCADLEKRAADRIATLEASRRRVLLRGHPDAASFVAHAEASSAAATPAEQLRPAHFWLRALCEQESTRAVLRQRDLPALEYLYDIRVTSCALATTSACVPQKRKKAASEMNAEEEGAEDVGEDGRRGGGGGKGGREDEAQHSGSEDGGRRRGRVKRRKGGRGDPNRGRGEGGDCVPASGTTGDTRDPGAEKGHGDGTSVLRSLRVALFFLPNPFFEDEILWVDLLARRGAGSPLLSPPVVGWEIGSATMVGQSGVEWKEGMRVNGTEVGKLVKPHGSLFWLFEGGTKGVIRATRAGGGGGDLEESLGDLLAGMVGDLMPRAYALYVTGRERREDSDEETELEDSDVEGGTEAPLTTRETILRVGRLFGQTGAGFVAGLLLLAGAVLVGTGRVRYPLSIAKAVVQWVARRAMWHGQHGARTVQLLAHVFTRGAFPYPDDIPMQPPQ